jgi:hypothetical protein
MSSIVIVFCAADQLLEANPPPCDFTIVEYGDKYLVHSDKTIIGGVEHANLTDVVEQFLRPLRKIGFHARELAQFIARAALALMQGSPVTLAIHKKSATIVAGGQTPFVNIPLNVSAEVLTVLRCRSEVLRKIALKEMCLERDTRAGSQAERAKIARLEERLAKIPTALSVLGICDGADFENVPRTYAEVARI